MGKIRVLIVDDESLARDKIRNFLNDEPDIEIVGESNNGEKAITTIREQMPELVFLDIQMPKLDGFGVIEKIAIQNLPYIIFVTAYDQYALQAFEVHALDYLLKPYTRKRFQKALQRAKEQLRQKKDLNYRVDKLIREIKSNRQYLQRLMVKSKGRIFFLKTDELDWIEGAGNYVCLHTGKEEHLIRDSMNNLENKLDPNKFIRTHRSQIINIDRIKELQSWFSGDYVIILEDDTQLTLSRKYREDVLTRLGRLF